MITLLQKLIHRAALDTDFRTRLQADPYQAALSLGLTPDEETRQVLVSMQEQPQLWHRLNLAEESDPGVSDPDWAAGPSFTSAALTHS